MLSIFNIFAVIIAVLIILVVLIQPAQRTGLIGDATDSEKREKRGFELFLFRSTILLIFLLFVTSLVIGAYKSGLFNFF
ncbi:MAG: preprotein translocase subunit SecG [Mycoplasmatales bacterium]